MKMNWQTSIFSDGSEQFVNVREPKLGDQIQVSIRFWKESPVENVYVSAIVNGHFNIWKTEKLKEDKRFVYYGISMTILQPRLQYQFVLTAEGKLYYYSQAGLFTSSMDRDHDFVLVAGYHQPDWIRNAVFYQIFPERFCNGDPSLSVREGEYQVDGYDTIQIKDWNTPAGHYDQCHCADFYGGDLTGIQQQIPYLKKLGVNAIYLNPIFQAPSVHKYDCIDYLHVDPHFGGDEALASLSQALHENGMRLILDISINHTGTSHKWFNKDGRYYDTSVGAYHNPEAQERGYYMIHADGTYECWDGVPSLPQLNYASDSLRDALYRSPDSVLKKWLKPPYSIDGWRFDVADVMANHNENQLAREVWPEIRESIRSENADAYILAEHWDDGVEFMQGDSWDAPMNYYGFGRLIRQFYGVPDPFVELTPELWQYTCHVSAEDYRSRVEGYLGRLPYLIRQNQFNLFDSHDVGRFAAYPGVTREKFHGAILASFTMPGVPSVYYGDELAIDGKVGFFEGARYPMPWDRAEEEGETYRLHQSLIHMRKQVHALREGSFRFLYAADEVIAYARFDDEECYITVISANEKEQEITLELDALGYAGPDREVVEMLQRELRYTVKQDGSLRLRVPAWGMHLIRVR